MTAYQPRQTSGNQWPGIPDATMRQGGQETLRRGFGQGGAVFADERETHLREVRKHFVSSDPSVATYLVDHPTLSGLLLEARGALSECFGRETVLTLRAPIDESGSRTLYAVAMWPGSLTDVRNALSRFDEDWWLARSRQAFGRLVFTYELV